MTSKIVILALILLACSTTLAMADGGFYGYVSYGGIGCFWANYDKVTVLNTDTNQSGTYDVYQVYNGLWYDMAHGQGPTSWPAGHYRIWVSTYNDPDCGPAVVQIVTHGSSNQQVNLKVLGPSGDPTRPQGP